jgi:hypothetical protein
VVSWVKHTPTSSLVVGIYISVLMGQARNFSYSAWARTACDKLKGVSRVPAKRTKCREGIVHVMWHSCRSVCKMLVRQSRGFQERNRHVGRSAGVGVLPPAISVKRPFRYPRPKYSGESQAMLRSQRPRPKIKTQSGHLGGNLRCLLTLPWSCSPP